jgi:hypothetical protein
MNRLRKVTSAELPGGRALPDIGSGASLARRHNSLPPSRAGALSRAHAPARDELAAGLPALGKPALRAEHEELLSVVFAARPSRVSLRRTHSELGRAKLGVLLNDCSGCGGLARLASQQALTVSTPALLCVAHARQARMPAASPADRFSFSSSLAAPAHAAAGEGVAAALGAAAHAGPQRAPPSFNRDGSIGAAAATCAWGAAHMGAHASARAVASAPTSAPAIPACAPTSAPAGVSAPTSAPTGFSAPTSAPASAALPPRGQPQQPHHTYAPWGSQAALAQALTFELPPLPVLQMRPRRGAGGGGGADGGGGGGAEANELGAATAEPSSAGIACVDPLGSDGGTRALPTSTSAAEPRRALASSGGGDGGGDSVGDGGGDGGDDGGSTHGNGDSTARGHADALQTASGAGEAHTGGGGEASRPRGASSPLGAEVAAAAIAPAAAAAYAPRPSLLAQLDALGASGAPSPPNAWQARCAHAPVLVALAVAVAARRLGRRARGAPALPLRVRAELLRAQPPFAALPAYALLALARLTRAVVHARYAALTRAGAVAAEYGVIVVGELRAAPASRGLAGGGGLAAGAAGDDDAADAGALVAAAAATSPRPSGVSAGGAYGSGALLLYVDVPTQTQPGLHTGGGEPYVQPGPKGPKGGSAYAHAHAPANANRGHGQRGANEQATAAAAVERRDDAAPTPAAAAAAFASSAMRRRSRATLTASRPTLVLALPAAALAAARFSWWGRVEAAVWRADPELTTRAAMLGRAAALRALPREALLRAASLCRAAPARPGQLLLEQGGAGTHCLLLLRGTVHLYGHADALEAQQQGAGGGGGGGEGGRARAPLQPGTGGGADAAGPAGVGRGHGAAGSAAGTDSAAPPSAPPEPQRPPVHLATIRDASHGPPRAAAAAGLPQQQQTAQQQQPGQTAAAAAAASATGGQRLARDDDAADASADGAATLACRARATPFCAFLGAEAALRGRGARHRSSAAADVQCEMVAVPAVWLRAFVAALGLSVDALAAAADADAAADDAALRAAAAGARHARELGRLADALVGASGLLFNSNPADGYGGGGDDDGATAAASPPPRALGGADGGRRGGARPAAAALGASHASREILDRISDAAAASLRAGGSAGEAVGAALSALDSSRPSAPLARSFAVAAAATSDGAHADAAEAEALLHVGSAAEIRRKHARRAHARALAASHEYGNPQFTGRRSGGGVAAAAAAAAAGGGAPPSFARARKGVDAIHATVRRRQEQRDDRYVADFVQRFGLPNAAAPVG